MCGRFALHSNPEVIALYFGLESVPALAPRYNIAPDAPVLVVAADGAAVARWRLKGKAHNVRAESLRDKPAFRNTRRCLVPANGFYEWKRAGRITQPYYVHPAQGELFAFAGLCDAESCAVITTVANRVVSRIHDRMPAIVPREHCARWLAGAGGLLAPAPDESIVAYPVGAAVNRAANDSPELIRPAPSAAGATRDLFGD